MTKISTPHRTQLSLAWRRGLVTLSLGGLGILLLVSILSPAQPVWQFVSVVVAALLLCSGWLLADTLWPWWGGDALTAAERAHADSTLRSSYRVLVAVAVVLMVLLQLRGGSGSETDGVEGSLLWGFLVLVVVLPMAVSAWSYPVGPAAGIGPQRLLIQRLTGPEAPVHLATVVALATASMVLVVGFGLGGGSGPLARAAGVAGLLVVAGLALFLGWLVIGRDRRRGGPGVR